MTEFEKSRAKILKYDINSFQFINMHQSENSIPIFKQE